MKGGIQKLKAPIVFDASALFNFGHRGEIEFLLKNLKKEYELIIPPSVEKQTQIKIELKTYYQKLIADYFNIKIAFPASSLLKTFEAIVQKLGEADADVIALGLDTNGTIIMDDRKARKESQALGIQLMGTVGLINHCLQQYWLTQEEAIKIVKKLIERGSRIPILKEGQTFEEYLRSIGE